MLLTKIVLLVAAAAALGASSSRAVATGRGLSKSRLEGALRSLTEVPTDLENSEHESVVRTNVVSRRGRSRAAGRSREASKDLLQTNRIQQRLRQLAGLTTTASPIFFDDAANETILTGVLRKYRFHSGSNARRTTVDYAWFFDAAGDLRNVEGATAALQLTLESKNYSGPLRATVAAAGPQQRPYYQVAIHILRGVKAGEPAVMNIDVSSFVRLWFSSSTATRAFSINLSQWNASGGGGDELGHYYRSSLGWHSVAPNGSITMTVSLRLRGNAEVWRARQKRTAAGSCGESHTYSFYDLGPQYDFIVSPRSFTTFVCGGTCTASGMARNGSAVSFAAFCKEEMRESLFVTYVDARGVASEAEIRDFVTPGCTCAAERRAPVL